MVANRTSTFWLVPVYQHIVQSVSQKARRRKGMGGEGRGGQNKGKEEVETMEEEEKKRRGRR